MQYFFVCGEPKSGTTWLQTILDAHPQVVCSGEGAFLNRLVKPIYEAIDGYNKYQDHSSQEVYGGDRIYRDINKSEISQALKVIILNLMSERATKKTRAIGDKTPRHNRYLNGVAHLFPRAKTINIVRHPYDVAVSKLFHAFRSGYADAIVPGSSTQIRMVQQCAADWAKAQELARDHGRQRPEKLIEVRYEDLLERPIPECSKLFEYLGVRADVATVSCAIEAASFERLSGGRARGTEDRHSFFRKGVTGDWQNHLTLEMTDVMDASCADLMALYQYPTARGQG